MSKEKEYAVALRGDWQGVHSRNVRDEEGKIIPELAMAWNPGQTRLINEQQLAACKKDLENDVLRMAPPPKPPAPKSKEEIDAEKRAQEKVAQKKESKEAKKEKAAEDKKKEKARKKELAKTKASTKKNSKKSTKK